MPDAPLPPPAGPLALFAALPGTNVPDRLILPFERSGFLCRRTSLDELRAAGRSDVLTLLWTGGDWDGGFAALDTLPLETIRRNTIIVGPDPPDRLGPRVRRAGGLTFLRDPIPGWLMPILEQTVARSLREQPLAILGGLRSLGEREDDSPLAMLKAIADVGGRLLGASRAMASVHDADLRKYLVLMDGDVGVVPRRWESGTEALEPPGGLDDAAEESQEIIVVPDVSWSRVAVVETGHRYYAAAVVVPVRVRGEGARETDPPLDATLSLYWDRPFLPTAGEMRLLDVLAALATANLRRLHESYRLASAHVASISALTALPRSLGQVSGQAGGSRGLQEELFRFVRATLSAFASTPQLLELWARVRPASRGDSAWLSLGAAAEAQQPPCVPSERAETEPFLLQPGRWAVTLSFPAVRGPEPPPGRGAVVAVFRSRVGAALAMGDLRSLCADLELGVLMLRRSADSGAVARLSRLMASAGDAEGVLLEMAELVRDRMASDGCRVYAVRYTPDGPRVGLVANTATGERGVLLGPILEGRGLFDWVLREDDWICVNAAVPGEKRGIEPELCRTGRHGHVRLLARARRSQDLTASPEAERARLHVPLYSHDRVAGVVEVWRDTAHPYDLELDVAALQHFAPHVASACRRVMQLESVAAELRGISTLTAALGATTRMRQAYEALVSEVGGLASAPAAVLLHHDASRPGHLTYGAAWAADVLVQDALESALRGLHIDAWTDAEDWARQLSEALPAPLKATRLDLRLTRLLQLPRGAGEWPAAVVAFLARPIPGRSPAPFAQDLAETVARSFLQYAGAIVETQVRATAMRLVERLGGPGESEMSGSDEVLAEAARLLHDVLGCDLVLAWKGEDAGLSRVAEAPARGDLAPRRCPPDGLLASVAADGRPVRVLDVDDARDPNQRRLDRAALGELAAERGWRGARSWLAVPLRVGGRTVGVLEAVTGDAGVFLGPFHEEVALTLARRAAWEIHKARGRIMLEDLNQRANALAGFEGPELGEAMVASLELWFSAYLGPGCAVAIASRVPHDRLLALQASKAVDRELLPWLEELSRDCSRQTLSWRAGPDVQLGGRGRGAITWHGLAEVLSIPGEEGFDGHLYLLTAEPVATEAGLLIREAAREVSLLLNGERLRQEWVLRSGLFRHAFLGPAQGLASAARALGLLAERSGAMAEDVRKLKARVEEEAENIRLWRENQRLYMGSTIEVRPKNQPLKPVVDRCVERYRVFMEQRGIQLRVEWPDKGAIVFPFDQDALDLALSNLLDNARKYVFFNREVTVGIRTDVRFVTLWVEDVGHPVPDRLRDEIYRIGKRFDWKDPVRPIGGQGLGLPMAKAVVEAHQGSISHTCEPEGAVQDGEREGYRPFRVRFTMRFPHHWRRR